MGGGKSVDFLQIKKRETKNKFCLSVWASLCAFSLSPEEEKRTKEEVRVLCNTCTPNRQRKLRMCTPTLSARVCRRTCEQACAHASCSWAARHTHARASIRRFDLLNSILFNDIRMSICDSPGTVRVQSGYSQGTVRVTVRLGKN